MALVIFLRGVNVGGHRTFRPSILARELSDYGVVNVGAAGTFVVHKPGPRAKFRAELLRKLPFETEVVLCDGRDLIRLEMENPFGASRPDVVRFVSILSKVDRGLTSIRFTLPPRGEWFVRVIASKNRFVFGEYRRHMKTIGYLGQIDKLFGVPATTRNWNTIVGSGSGGGIQPDGTELLAVVIEIPRADRDRYFLFRGYRGRHSLLDGFVHAEIQFPFGIREEDGSFVYYDEKGKEIFRRSVIQR